MLITDNTKQYRVINDLYTKSGIYPDTKTEENDLYMKKVLQSFKYNMK